MDRKLIYKKTNEFIKGRMTPMVMSFIVIGLINGVLSSVFESNSIIIGIVLSIITSILFGGYTIEMFKTFKEGRAFKVMGFLGHIGDHFSAIATVAALVAGATYLVGQLIGLFIVLIPGLLPFLLIVSFIIGIFFDLFATFAYIVIADKDIRKGNEALMEARAISKGYVKDYFMLVLKYSWPIMLVFLALIVSLYPLIIAVLEWVAGGSVGMIDPFLMVNDNLFFFMFLLLILLLVVGVYFGIKIYAATVIFYNNIVGNELDFIVFADFVVPSKPEDVITVETVEVTIESDDDLDQA